MSNPEDDLSEEEIRTMERNLLASKPRRGPIVAVSHRKSSVPKKGATEVHILAQWLSKYDEEEERLFQIYIVSGGVKTLRATDLYREEINKLVRDYRRDSPKIEVRWFNPNGEELHPL
ncbi:hypothetical protein D8666_14580 [Ochrobactrum soli]|uniref:hypothetical protein n=1 Tax=Ochrobactrum soli TaxID=2448455 RepID=UPI000EF19B74|nr:hypothetical protein [[Ochrobactrum] soli]RLL73834.1 hypothetical protein D8666_14580 [[Ochrobactrum] soli]